MQQLLALAAGSVLCVLGAAVPAAQVAGAAATATGALVSAGSPDRPSSAERPERAGAGGRSHRAGHPRGGRCGLCQLITEPGGSLSWLSICPGIALSGRPRAGPGDGNLGAALGKHPVWGCAARPSPELR